MGLLIVNADDLGLHDAVSRGILEAHRATLVRSTSLIVNMPSSEPGVELVRNESALEIGLHLNVTEGSCVAPRERVAGLVDEDGRFLFDTMNIGLSIQRWRERVDTQLVDQIAVEIEAQVERFRTFGLRLAHLNAHHYFPLFHPRICSVYVRAAEMLGVPFRGICKPMIEILRLPAPEEMEIRKLIAQARVPSPAVSISNLFDGSDAKEMPAAQYERAIDAKLADEDGSSVELIVHPTHSEGSPQPYEWARRVETALVHSERFRRGVEARGSVVLAGYSALCATLS